MATAIQFLRSSELGLRPIPLSLTDGMPMINYNSADPGLYFRTSTDTLAKIGPCHVGSQPPNQTPLGYAEYCTGEMWLDTSLSSAPVLKVWNGSAWAFDLNTDESTLTAGAYLTGGSFDGSAAVTFAVDATDANTASKVVARDASGNFAAGTITTDSVVTTNSMVIGGDLTVNTDALFVDASAKQVGIATSSPNYPLDVNGGMGITEGQSVHWHDGSGNISAQIYGDSGDNIVFRNTSSTVERMQLNSSGSLLIGPAGAPATTITAAGAATFAGNINAGTPNYSSAGTGAWISASDGKFYSYVDSDTGGAGNYFFAGYSGTAPKALKFSVDRAGDATFTGTVSATQVNVTSLIALTDLGSDPTGAVGNLCSVNGNLKYHDGTSWKTVTVS